MRTLQIRLPALAYAALLAFLIPAGCSRGDASAAPPGSDGACTCGSSDPAKPCTATSISRSRGGYTFSADFTCNGRACQCGQYATGDWWIAAIDDTGAPASGVRFTSLSPAGTQHGAMVNPTDFQGKQGMLAGYSSYDASKNVMGSLPYTAPPNTSLLKGAKRSNSSTCATKSIQGSGCFDSYEVYTVVGSVPPNLGASSFRPPIAGSQKVLYSVDDIRWDRIPKIPAISSASSQHSLASIRDRWRIPTGDWWAAWSGDRNRAFHPHNHWPTYSAELGKVYLADLLSVFGTESDARKRGAVIAMLQRGLDIYHYWKNGGRRPPGAGQMFGYYPALLFWGAAGGHDKILQEIHDDLQGTDIIFAEIGQFQRNTNPAMPPVWGVPSKNLEYFADAVSSLNLQCGESTYWARYIAGTSSKRTCNDPYGYIDGPEANLTNTYQGCCSGGNIIGTSFAAHLMPAMRWGLGSDQDKFIRYMYRLKDGTGIPDFDGGIWASPDPCRGPTEDCDPRRKGSCQEYGVTWGPDGAGDCIKGSPNRTKNTPYHDGALTLHDEPVVMKGTWSRLKRCLDPTNPAYPCPGMPSEVVPE